MKFLKKLFQKKQNDFFKIEDCEFENKEYDNGEWIEYRFDIRNKKLGWLGSMHTEESATPYFDIKYLSVLYNHGNYDVGTLSEKVIHGTTDLRLGRIFWYNQSKGEISNLEAWQMPSGKVTGEYAYPTTITFREAESNKAKFKPNQFICWLESDCFHELIKLIESDNIGHFHVSFSDEIKPNQKDMWHYLDFTQDNKLKLPNNSMWGISEENNWEAIPRISIESKRIRVKQED